MARTHQTYPREIRQQLVEMVRAGRTPEELAQEYEPSAGSIRNWVAQSERDAGQRSDGLGGGHAEQPLLRDVGANACVLAISPPMPMRGLPASGSRRDTSSTFAHGRHLGRRDDRVQGAPAFTVTRRIASSTLTFGMISPLPVPLAAGGAAHRSTARRLPASDATPLTYPDPRRTIT